MPRATDEKRRPPTPEPGSGLVGVLQELGAVFRAESGMACRLSLTADDTPRDPAVSDGVYRTVRELLNHISKRGRASLVTLSSGTHDDGSFFIRVENDGLGRPGGDGAALRASGRVDLSIIDRRMMELGVYVQIDADSLCAWIVVPKRLMVRA